MSNTQLAIKGITDSIAQQVRGFVSAGSLQLPDHYSAENALKEAALMLPSIKDAQRIPVLQSCTAASIKASLLSMCVQGLSPDKKQCYFIPYGETLTLQRSYFGSIAVAKRVSHKPISDIYADVVYKDDVFEYEKKHGNTVITTHKQKIENVNKNNIIAAYANVIYGDNTESATIMSFEDIKQAWAQSAMKPVDDKGNVKKDSTHGKFTAEMCKKTVINKACKPIIDGSDDSNLVVRYAKQTDESRNEADVNAEVEENANKVEADFTEVPDGVDPQTGEVKEEEPF